MLNTIDILSQKLNVEKFKIEKVMELLQEGSTIPFIARYRKNITGGLDEEVLEAINQNYTYVEELNKRKEAIIKILQEKDLLNDDLKKSIISSDTKSKLEDIYEPYKEGKKTKATEAIALGLKPLAEVIMNNTDENFNPFIEAKKYISEKVANTEFAIQQASLIIAEMMSQDLVARKVTYNQLFTYGQITSKKKRSAKDEKEKFRQYYEHSEKVNKIPNHRILSMFRGEKLKILNIDIDFNKSKLRYDLNEHFFKVKTTGKILLEALDDSMSRLIVPSIKRQIFRELFERAEKSAIELFANNLETMLLSPAIKGKKIIAIDPGFVSGCKVAAISESGNVQAIDVIKPHHPFKKISESESIINSLIDKFNSNLIVIGNGTASRETESFIANLLKKRKDDIKFAIVSEVGASVYSASKIAIKEFPDLSVEQRSAIHIGRKFQDPLNEIVKIDPKAIGVGQYQHDVNQKELQKALDFKVKKAVNQVGVDLNTATEAILTHISGLTKTTVKNIVDFRKENGSFKNRKEVKNVKGVGNKAFEQAIGFLRINDSDNFYDKTSIHPESYKLADLITKKINFDFDNIKSFNKDSIDNAKLANELSSNEYDVDLIIESLSEPGKDIRESKDGPLLKSDVLELKDLKEGTQLEGEVQNITDFGIFVYVGLKQAVFIHISKLSDSFVKHPSDIVKTNQHVSVEIIEIDKERSRVKGKLIND